MTKATDLNYRVIPLPATLRQAIRRKRDESEITNEEFVGNAVEQHLPKILATLAEVGFEAKRKSVGPLRLPFSDKAKTLARLRQASQATRIPSVHLLEACLTMAIKPAKKQRRRRATKSKI